MSVPKEWAPLPHHIEELTDFQRSLVACGYRLGIEAMQLECEDLREECEDLRIEIDGLNDSIAYLQGDI